MCVTARLVCPALPAVLGQPGTGTLNLAQPGGDASSVQVTSATGRYVREKGQHGPGGDWERLLGVKLELSVRPNRGNPG